MGSAYDRLMAVMGWMLKMTVAIIILLHTITFAYDHLAKSQGKRHCGNIYKPLDKGELRV